MKNSFSQSGENSMFTVSRTYKNGEYGAWKINARTLAEKIPLQRKIREVMEELRKARHTYYETEPHGKIYRDLYAKYFRIHRRRGYEIHELVF